MKRSILILAVALLPLCGTAPAQTVELVSQSKVENRKSKIPVVAYIEIAELKGSIPDRDLLGALDDNQDGVIDDAIWAQIQTDVQEAIDGRLGQRYSVPFAAPLPAVVKLAAKTFALEAIYNRRGLLNEKSPERVNANTLREKLSAIASGEEPLAPGKERARPSASAITEPSRTCSDRPAI